MRRRIGSTGPLCNGPTPVIWLLALTFAIGCKPEPAPIEAAADAGQPVPMDAVVDAEVIPPVPVPPLELFRRMPSPPAPIAAVPGDLARGLGTGRPGARPSSYTDKVLVDRPADGPFEMIHYQLTPDGRTVQAVLATLVPGYAAGERREALEEAISQRLGRGEPLTGSAYRGTRWTTLPFRIDLRTDAATGDLELLYHRRGRVDPVAIPSGAP